MMDVVTSSMPTSVIFFSLTARSVSKIFGKSGSRLKGLRAVVSLVGFPVYKLE